MVVIFQLISFTYLDLFKEKRYVGFAPMGKEALVASYIIEYNRINYLGSLFSSALVFHLIEKILFNFMAKKKLPYDTWTIVDFVSAALNLFCFNVIGSVTVAQLLDVPQKRILDYYVITVTIVSWCRFFSFFFLVRIISKLLHTLIRMIRDTLSFLFLLICYFLLMATAFTMLFQRSAPDRFGDPALSLRSLFDAFIGEYTYLDEASNFATSFQLLMMLHVFISNILLLNYLIAILSTVFVLMRELGEFEYRCNKYQFIEKYAVPMLDTDGLQELVIHPPPLNFLTLPILTVLCSRPTLRNCAPTFSKFVFWLENVPYIFAFLVYECALAPVAYFKQLVSFVFKATWRNFLVIVPLWIVCGPLVIAVVGVLGDLVMFLRVLADYKEQEEEERQRVEDEFKKDKVILYNELMDVMRAIMHIYKKREEEEKGRRKKLLQ